MEVKYKKEGEMSRKDSEAINSKTYAESLEMYVSY